MSPAPPISVQGMPQSIFPPSSQSDPLKGQVRLYHSCAQTRPPTPITFHPTQHEIQSPDCSLMMRPFSPTTLVLWGSSPASLAPSHTPASGHVHFLLPVPSTFSPLIRDMPSSFLKLQPSPPRSSHSPFPHSASCPQH